MKNKTIYRLIYFTVLVMGLSIFTLSIFNCSGKSEDELIRESIDKIGEYAEDGNMNGVLRFLSLDYSDDDGRTIDDIEELLEDYFQRYRGIAVNVLGTKIKTVKVPEAGIETEVSLSSGAAKFFRKAVRYSGRFYRFTVKMVKEKDTWKVKNARWESITLEDLFPESFKLLKEIFPNSF